MKASTTHLGHKIQQFLLENRAQLDDVATEMLISPDSLSNLIHGRRRFKDETLQRLAATSLFKKNEFSYETLKAYRALDEYTPDELAQAVAIAISDDSEVLSLSDESTHRLGLLFQVK